MKKINKSEQDERFITYYCEDNKVIHCTTKHSLMSTAFAVIDNSDIKFLENKDEIIGQLKAIINQLNSPYIYERDNIKYTIELLLSKII